MKKILILFIFFVPFICKAQEVLTGLATNPVIKNYNKKNAQIKSYRISDTIPFIDDFSKNEVFPDQSHWINKYVFINNQYGYNPATVGVATFDALDADGKIYKTASFNQFGADTLTSVNIKLDSIYTTGQKSVAIKKSDSLYFSFLYQPGGYGNAPDIKDTLILEFYSHKYNKWTKVWSSTGSSFETFKAYLDSGKYRPYKTKFKNLDSNFYFTDSILHTKLKVDFKVVMIPIKDSVRYYSKNFKFRFRNYASVSDNYLSAWAAGNVDIWNIDYVYINTKRSIYEKTFPNDVGFYNYTTSFLKNYQAMPWNQYLSNPAAETKSNLEYKYINFFDKTLNIDQEFSITDLSHVNAVYKLNNENFGNMPPLKDNVFTPKTNNYTFPDNKLETCEFELLAYIKANIQDRDINPNNDTIRYKQIFDNYYAYDDGNAEAGYGLSVAGAYLAYQFELSKADSLSSVAIFFNSVKDNSNRKPFSIVVWSDTTIGSTHQPNRILFVKNNYLPVDSGLDLFKVYHLDTLLPLAKGNYYVGLKQTTKDNLNIGFDKNDNNQSKLYYNTDGLIWRNSIYSGSLMIRPVFGKYLNESIEENRYTDNDIIIYPNPIKDNKLRIAITDELKKKNLNVEVYSVLGSRVFSGTYSETVNLNGIPNGLYIIRLVSSKNNKALTKKIIIDK